MLHHPLIHREPIIRIATKRGRRIFLLLGSLAFVLCSTLIGGVALRSIAAGNTTQIKLWIMLIIAPIGSGPLRPLHGLLLAFPVALFTACVVTDIAYLNTAEMQWTNFSAWLNAGGMVFAGAVTLWALVGAVLGRAAGPAVWIYPVVLVLMSVIGLLNAFHHSRDAWASVGTTGLVLSILTALLALAAGWIFHAAPVRRVEDL